MISDTDNFCIRYFNKSALVVTTYAGRCGVTGRELGHRLQARFGLPMGLAITDRYLYIIDSDHHSIVKLDMNTGTVSEYMSSLKPRPYFIADITSNLVTTDVGVLDLSTKRILPYFRVNGEFHDIIRLGRVKYLVADKIGNRLYFINTDKQMIDYICQGSEGPSKPGSDRSCVISQPVSLLLVGDTVYAGGKATIMKFTIGGHQSETTATVTTVQGSEIPTGR